MDIICCPECGNEITKNDKFCSNCGLNLEKSEKNNRKKQFFSDEVSEKEADNRKNNSDLANDSKAQKKLSGCSKFLLVMLAIFIPPVGMIAVLKSKSFSKFGKGLSVAWTCLFILLIAIPSGQNGNGNNDVAQVAEEKQVVEEQVNNEEQEEVPISAKDIDDYINHLISSTAGHSTNTGYERVLDFSTNGTNNDTLILYLQGDENFTTGMTRGGIMMNSEDIIKQAFEERGDVNRLELKWYMVLVDQMGNKNNTNIITIEFSRNTYNQINWDNFLRDNLPNVADYFWAHPNYR